MNADTTETDRAPQVTSAPALYRERLSPSLWALLSATVVAPMVTLVFVPLDATWALVIGVAAGAALVASLVYFSPIVEVRGGVLRVGRAHIPVRMLGEPNPAVGAEARELRGPSLPRTAWHLFRGGIDGVVSVPVTDDRDLVSEWVFSTRTPDRLAAAIKRAR